MKVEINGVVHELPNDCTQEQVTDYVKAVLELTPQAEAPKTNGHATRDEVNHALLAGMRYLAGSE